MHKACNDIATLEVSPKPDTQIRVYMEFQAVQKPYNISPQQFQPIKRQGFTLVEWGGTEFKSEMLTGR